MAYINNYHVFVEKESMSRGVEVTKHAVETGLPITDNAKRSPKVLSVTGEIVGDNAEAIAKNLEALHFKGANVKYRGINILENAVITSFNTDNDCTIYGGYAFSMQIEEVRIAKSAYVEPDTTTKKTTKSGTQQVQNNSPEKYHTVKKGDCLWNIAKKYYGSGASYKKIYEANKSKIKNPNLIYPGQVFLIP